MAYIENSMLSRRMKVALVSLVLCIFIPSYNYFLNEILQYDLGMGSISALSYILLAIVGLYSYTYLPKVRKPLLVIMFIIILALFISYLRYPEIKEFFINKDYNPLTSILLFVPFIGFPMMLYTNYLSKNLHYIVDYIRYPSLSLIILSILDYYWTVLVNGHFFDVNYMSFSYYMLPGVCLSFYYGISKGRVLDWVVAIIGLIVIFITGSRGCFLCGVSFLALACFKRYPLSVGKTLLFLFSIIAFFLFVSHFFPSFSDGVMSYMDEHGASSRTLMKLSDGTIEESDSRNSIYRIMLKAIDEQPLGYGPMGDRYILYRHDNQGYAHSIIYEFLVDYGVIIGPVLLIALVSSIFIRLKQHFKQDMYYLYALFLATGFIKLFFSGSYLEESFFWGLIGLLFIKKTKIRNGYKD